MSTHEMHITMYSACVVHFYQSAACIETLIDIVTHHVAKMCTFKKYYIFKCKVWNLKFQTMPKFKISGLGQHANQKIVAIQVTQTLVSICLLSWLKNTISYIFHSSHTSNYCTTCKLTLQNLQLMQTKPTVDFSNVSN